ncbi:hypothetical protein LCGC14_1024480 [marine sediment metagenome]|uniref:Uncharacterized protein n=1 Tax=marine sediment metagenome TaxID=412755 RepID=A0A0F9QEG9_9ZZZZ
MAKRYVVRLTDEERTQRRRLFAERRLAAQKRKRAHTLPKADARIKLKRLYPKIQN